MKFSMHPIRIRLPSRAPALVRATRLRNAMFLLMAWMLLVLCSSGQLSGSRQSGDSSDTIRNRYPDANDQMKMREQKAIRTRYDAFNAER